uniref:Seminal fluid protein n=1 Tax=Nilaparvata lugens TaxID=108931 RepID=A0A1I9WL98_NILLU|nr:seminal fluid protein [Nilaparvata lugens]
MFSLGFAVTLLVILLGTATISNQSPIRSEVDDKLLLTHKQLISKRSPADQQMNKAPKGGDSSKTPGQNTLGMIAESYKTKNSTGGGNEPKCPAGFSGLMPHPTDCEQYLNCDAGTASIQKCGPGTVFSPDHKTCDHPENVDCSGPTGVPKTGLKEVPKTGLKDVPKTGLKEVPQTGDKKEKEKVVDPKKEKGGDKKEGNKEIGKGVDEKKEVVEKKGEDKKKEVEDKKNGKGEDKKKQVEEKKKVKREERVEKDEEEKEKDEKEKPNEMSFKTKGKKIQRDWSNIEN